MTETLTSSLLWNLGKKWHEAQVEPIDLVRQPLIKCWKSLLSCILQFALNGTLGGRGRQGSGVHSRLDLQPKTMQKIRRQKSKFGHRSLFCNCAFASVQK